MSNNKKLQLDQPLTLEMLMEYNRKILFPEMEERFVTKKEFKNSQDKIFDRLDKILKNIEVLHEEKEVRKFQRNKDKQLYLIIINALKQHRILSDKELAKISELGIF